MRVRFEIRVRVTVTHVVLFRWVKKVKRFRSAQNAVL